MARWLDLSRAIDGYASKFQGRTMKDIHAVIREKEQQVRQLMEQIDKLRCAAQILEDENPLGVVEEPVRAASIPKPVEAPRSDSAKRVWP
ncbi:MAG: hypothetical protein ROO76_14705 [Terriglobia bacterium]|jgi:hypothetical protein|nr:hypothetical protein [Terriglobia bacterium]